MARPLSPPFLSHWHKPYADFQTSALEFYTLVETALQRMAIPGLTTSRVVFHEGGALSARREYLRVRRSRLTFDLCAAPFGTGYFFSWWLGVRKASRWLLLVALAQLEVSLVIAQILVRGFRFGGFRRVWLLDFHPIARFFIVLPVIIAVFLILGLVVRLLPRLWGGDPDDTVVVIPLIGPFYERHFKPVTYFRTDTILMFQSLVKGVVEESINAVTTVKGIRALTEEEKKPVMRELLKGLSH